MAIAAGVVAIVALAGSGGALVPVPPTRDAVAAELPYAAGLLTRCTAPPGRTADLTAALIAAERAVQRPASRIFERAVLLPLAHMGVAVGDFSVGDAQIRPSTAVRHVPELSGQGRAESYRRLIADDCATAAAAYRYVRDITDACSARDGPLDACELEAARRFNGQATFGPENVFYLREVAAAFDAAMADDVAAGPCVSTCVPTSRKAIHEE